MPPKPNLARREELLDQLIDIFVVEGFSHLRVGALANRLKCSRSTLYELADSKELLFLRVVERWADGAIVAGMESAEGQSTAKGKVREFLHAIAVVQERTTPHFWDDVYGDPIVAERFNEAKSWGIDKVREYFEEGIASGELRPVNTTFVAHVLWLGARASRDPEVLAATGLTSGEAVDEIADLMIDGVGHPEARTS